MKIILAGGGTAGSVMPLLAIYSEIKEQRPDAEFIFIGTRNGEPEKKLLRGCSIYFKTIYGGKLRRYFDIRNISDMVLILIGFFQSLIFIYQQKADVIVGAGGYISVPVIWAGWVLRKKILIHQQDIRPSLSNIFSIFFASRITVTFEKSLMNFPVGKTTWTGNPVRKDIWKGDGKKAIKTFRLKPGLPIILIVGGSTGALGMNTIANQALPELIKFCQIIHLTGAGKRVTGIQSDRYQQHEFLGGEMNDILQAADLVISRAGLSAVSEFCVLGKPVILVPLPESHQENNASYFAEKGAAVVIQQQNLSPSILVDKIKKLIEDKQALSILAENIKKIMKPGANKLISGEIIKLAEE